MNLQEVLAFLYSEEQHVTVSCFWDSGWTFQLNGESASFEDLSEGTDWLLQTFAEKRAKK